MNGCTASGGSAGLAVLLALLSGPVPARASSPPDPVLGDGALDAFELDARKTYEKAYAAHQAKNGAEAVRGYLATLHVRPDHARTWYNLACCYGLLGKASLAMRALQRAVELGYEDLAHLRKDPDFDPIRKDAAFVGGMRQIETYLSGLGETLLVERRMLAPCRVRLPEDYDPARRYPLVVVLHGSGAFAQDYLRIQAQLGSRDVILAAPAGAYAMGDGMDPRGPGRSWFLQTRDRQVWRRADPLAVEGVLAAIRQVQAAHPTSGVYLLGHSQGAALAYLTGVEHPEAVEGILCFGGLDPADSLAPEALAKAAPGLKVFIAHGCWDVQVDVARARQAKAFLEKHGFAVTYTEFAGGHELGRDALRDAGAWIRGQARKAPVK